MWSQGAEAARVTGKDLPSGGLLCSLDRVRFGQVDMEVAAAVAQIHQHTVVVCIRSGGGESSRREILKYGERAACAR